MNDGRNGYLHLTTALLTLVPIAFAPLSAVAQSAGPVEGSPEGCVVDGRTCHASLVVDIDGDGRADSATLETFAREGIYAVRVRFADGRFVIPVSGAFDPASDRVSLVWREGGDVRCRTWTPGKYCGFPLPFSEPHKGLFLEHSRDGAFAIVWHERLELAMTPARWFEVVTAMSGASTDDQIARRH